jgi:hypothetical protein
MKPKRGMIREDGKIYWAMKHGKEYWVSSEVFDRKKTKYLEKRIAIKNIENKRKCGDVREDGKIFWGYNALCIDCEYWVNPLKYKELLRINAKRMKKIRKNNPHLFIERCKKWRIKNREYTLEYQKSYSKSNRSKINANHKKRLSTEPLYKIRVDASILINKAISRSGFKKNTKTASILGCSFEEFKTHIELQFQADMSWENRNLWHIDHIMPVSMAETYDEVIRLNHYKNLRPLWAHENLAKSHKTPDILVLF